MMLMGPPSEMPHRAVRSEPTASSTAFRSSIRSSRAGTPTTGSESPVPRLSHRISRENDASRANNSGTIGISQ